MKIIVQRENLVLWHLICFSVLLAFTACSDNKGKLPKLAY